jgi:hypothetical protein
MLGKVILLGGLMGGLSACGEPPRPAEQRPVAGASAQPVTLTVTRFDPPACEPNAVLPERQAYMLGWASLSRGKEALEGVLDCAARTWTGDSDADDTKSSVLWAVLRISQEVFVNAMADRQAILDDWLGPTLEASVFEGGFDGDPCPYRFEISETRDRVVALKVTGDARLAQTKIVERLARTTCSGSQVQ